MIINAGNLKALYIAFSAAFGQGLALADSNYVKIATVISSTTKTNEYGWLGQFPKMREWLGDRVVNGMAVHGYSIRNRAFEATVGVGRDDIEDDNLGIFTPMMQQLGKSAAENPDELVFALLKAGPATLCYDGQYFFDTDHPVLAADGTVESQSNWNNNGGAGTPWYLLDTRSPLKPLIFQERKKPKFVAKDQENDDNVFDRREFVYGVDSRCNVGFGFWQHAYGSRAALDEASLIAAYTAMTERKGDNGRALGIKPSVLVVPPSLKFAAMKLVSATTLANGADNVLKGLVDVLDDTHLA